jgi:hypothetical protein
MAESTQPGRKKEERWRELCAAAAIEPDSDKLVSLVEQILEAFDEDEHGRVDSRSRSLQPRQSTFERMTRP